MSWRPSTPSRTRCRSARHPSPAGPLLCGVIIAGLGILNDVTITQTSAVRQLHSLAPEHPRRHLLTSAMRIGRDHIASTVYTIVLAYAGTALPVLVSRFKLLGRPVMRA